MKSSRDRATRMQSSTAAMSWNFQLSPFTAARYSRADIPFDRCERFSGGSTDSPCSKHSSSEIVRSFWSVSGCWRSIFPVSKQTALTTKWEWMCSASTWVAMTTSLSGHALAANSFAISCACSGVTSSCGENDCV